MTSNTIGKFILGMFVVLTSCYQKPVGMANLNPTEISHDSLIAKGAYLVAIMGCNDCHSPKIFGPNGMEPNPDLILSGHPSEMPMGKIDTTMLGHWLVFGGDLTSFAGPWGQSFAANITSDETGIGNWTEDQFRKAITEGKYKGLDGARMLLPPMPWQDFAHLKSDDVKAIFAYLKSTKPIKNVVPAPKSLADL